MNVRTALRSVSVVVALAMARTASADEAIPPAPAGHEAAPAPTANEAAAIATASVPAANEAEASPAPAVNEPTAPAPTPAPAPAPAPYSVPWQLRPIVAPTVVRLESSMARYEDRQGRPGGTVATVLTAAYRIPGTGPATAGLAPVVRVAFVTDDPAPGNATRGGAAFVNPLIGAGYAVKLDGGLRLNAFFGATFPFGGGGGDAPSRGAQNSRVKGVNARAQLDNALFAVNDLTVIPGFGVAWVRHGLTLQAEVTLLHLMRARVGAATQPEASKTNLTSGLHVGYFVTPALSVGAELRYQRWLNAPFAVEKDPTDASRDTLSFAIGPRGHFKVGDVGILRPGIAYQRGLDKPLAAATPNYHIVQLDLPMFF